MTAVDERPANGHNPPHELPSKSLPQDEPDEPEGEEQEPGPPESVTVTEFRSRLADRTAERELAHEFTTVDDDPVFEAVRSKDEQTADYGVAKKIRKKRRAEQLRAGKAAVRAQRRDRLQHTWMARAERARLRLLDPSRSLAADHRRWLYSSLALFALLAGGVAFMSDTVKVGLFGQSGSWIGYVIEPLASVLLIVSLMAQYTARQRDLDIPRGAVAFDLGLGLASLALNTIPWGVRFGFDPATLLVHTLVPALVIAAVVAWHLVSRIYGDALAASRQQHGQHADRLALLREATRAGELPVDVTATQVIKFLRNNLPGGIGHDAARQIARDFLGY